MPWYPARISTRLTLGGIVLLAVTCRAGGRLADLVNNVRQLMGEIRVAGEEQRKGVSEVTLAVSEMDSTVQQNASRRANPGAERRGRTARRAGFFLQAAGAC